MQSQSTSESRANGPEGRTTWDLVNWREANEHVVNLRLRIFKAARENDHRRVRSLQRLMLRRQFGTGHGGQPADETPDSSR